MEEDWGCGLSEMLVGVCSVHVLSKSGGRWAVYRCGCRSETHNVRCVVSEMSTHVSLTFAVEECEGVRTDVLDVACGANVVSRSSERWAVYGCSCTIERHGV